MKKVYRFNIGLTTSDGTHAPLALCRDKNILYNEFKDLLDKYEEFLFYQIINLDGLTEDKIVTVTKNGESIKIPKYLYNLTAFGTLSLNSNKIKEIATGINFPKFDYNEELKTRFYYENNIRINSIKLMVAHSILHNQLKTSEDYNEFKNYLLNKDTVNESIKFIIKNLHKKYNDLMNDSDAIKKDIKRLYKGKEIKGNINIRIKNKRK